MVVEERARHYCSTCGKGKGTSFAADTSRCFRALAGVARPPRYCDDCNSPLELRVSSGYEMVVLDAFVPRGTRWDDRNSEPTLYPFLVFLQPAVAGGSGRRVWMPSYLVHEDQVIEFSSAANVSVDTFRGLLEQAGEKGYAVTPVH
jgi:hypothetical protein